MLCNTLFQREEPDANMQSKKPRALGGPESDIGQHEALDVALVSLGRTVVALLHFRAAKLTPNVPNALRKLPSGVGHPYSIALS